MVTLAIMAGSASSRSRVLIVDDDAEMRDALGAFFEGQGHDCELAADAGTALGIVEHTTLDAIVCDVRMDGMNGLELLDRVQRTHPALPFVLVTAAGDVQDAVTAIKRGALQYLTKPCNLDRLSTTVANAIEDYRRLARADHARQGTLAAAQSFADLIGESPAMQALRACIDCVAASSAPVLITGETGSGKELVARAVHARGDRREKPFVAVNTSAIPESLLESEIFGYVRGAFTGATQSRKGLLTESDGGTLLLDEIGDMPFGLQAKLLRVLQFGEVRPIGSDRVHRTDVRVIASTHRDLEELVRAGRFREDLYFRLNVLPLHVPPLRERREDIPALVAHFLAEARQRARHSPVRAVGFEALQALTQAPWPGNVRELASVIERAVVFGAGETVTTRSLPTALWAEPARALPSFRGAPWTLRDLSRAYTDWVLLHAGGNKEQAAAILGIDLSTLYRWQRGRP
jgi:two-component system, NtrC family, response regulator HydG